MNLSRQEMIRALVIAIQKVHPDKHISVHEDKLTGSNRWVVTVDGLGIWDCDYACDVLAGVRAAKGLDEKSVDDLVADLLECSKAAQTAPKLGPATVALAPSPDPVAPAPLAINYDLLAQAMARNATAAAPAPGKQ